MALREKFSDQELAAIQAATRAAESQTGGELVCVLVERCDVYEATLWKGGLGGALAGAAVAALTRVASGAWGGAPEIWILLPPFLGAALGVLAVALLPAARRLLVPGRILERRVDRRAAEAFVDEEIFATRDRTGVLLFVALFEHRIRILRDRGVEERVPAEAWDEITRELAAGLRQARRGAALVAAIEACGRLLAQHGVTRRPDDEDELDDRPRLYDD